MKLSKSIQARVHAASLTVQQLVFDAICDVEIGADADAPASPSAMSIEDLSRIEAFIRVRLPGTVQGSKKYAPDADAVAFGLGAMAGRTVLQISHFFELEYDYVKLKLRRLREHARKA